MRRFCKSFVYLLVLCIAWTPFSVQAALVGTDQVAASAADRSNRERVAQFVQRGEVVKQLESLGVSPAQAAERVNALTQEEINQLAADIDSLPAGADTAGWVIGLAIIGAVIWYFWYR